MVSIVKKPESKNTPMALSPHLIRIIGAIVDNNVNVMAELMVKIYII